MNSLSPELITAALVAISLAAILVCLKSLRKDKDSRKLLDAVVSLCAGEAPGDSAKIENEEHLRVWHYVKMLNAMRGQVGDAENAYHEMLNFSAKMSEQGESVEQAAAEVCSLLTSQEAGDVSGVMVVLRSDDGPLEVVSSTGLPRARFESFVLERVGELLSTPSPQAAWQYVRESGGIEALSAFDIRLMLTVPLINSQGVCGAIWIAFQNELTATKERREFLELVAQNVATNFNTVIQVKHHTENVARERDFLLGMSHDLRAPGETALYAINAVRSACGGLSEHDRQHLDMAAQCVARQQALVGDVLKWAQHKKGVLQAYPSEVSIDALLAELVQAHMIGAAQKGLCLTCDSIPSVWVNVDCSHAKRILENLIANAIKYTDCGTIRVAFKTTGSHLEIQVIDTGIGVPKDTDPEQLFEQFVRMPNAKNRSGAGLGLSLCRALAEQNGGYLSYGPNKEHSSGSIFTVGLPLAVRADTPCQPHLPLQHVLLVDDDMAVCRTIKRYLSDAVEEFEMVEDIESAFVSAQMQQYDLVVTDLNVGAHDSYSLIEQLKDTPVVVVTGTSDLDLVRENIEHERCVILEKPLERLTLRQAVAKLLKPVAVNGKATPVSQEVVQ